MSRRDDQGRPASRIGSPATDRPRARTEVRMAAPAAQTPRPSAALPPVGSLEGWTVAVTGARRATDVVTLLQQRGARVLHVPAVRILPLEDEGRLAAATAECLARPFDLLVVTTGIGF